VRILVTEDEAKLAFAVKQGLEADDHLVSLAATGEEGFFLAQTQPFDVLIFDVMLPGRDGLEILGKLRSLGHRTPVLLLTSKDAVEDRVQGLNAGVDGYLCKPFLFSELRARVRALGRRSVPEAPAALKLGDLELDPTAHTVKRQAQVLDLTAREFDLLEYFLRQPGRVVSREMIAREVWKESARQTPIDNLIDVHIARLRRKLDDPFGQKLLHTIRGVGFVLRLE
jgi:two-component system, OmpR family, copper resistance phosphate regulon response regulator CusR